MTRLHSPFAAIAHASQTNFAMIGPEGALFLADRFHLNGLIGTEPSASSTPHTAIIGKHDLCHKEFAYQKIADGKKRNQPKDAYAPQRLPEVVASEIDPTPFQDPGH